MQLLAEGLKRTYISPHEQSELSPRPAGCGCILVSLPTVSNDATGTIPTHLVFLVAGSAVSWFFDQGSPLLRSTFLCWIFFFFLVFFYHCTCTTVLP